MANERTLIAEVGQNYCGSMELAELMIAHACNNGADMVKFQLFDSEKLYGKKIDAELTYEQAERLFKFGKKFGVMGFEVFFSVFDTERIKWCEAIGVKRYKVSYANRNNKELLEAIDLTGKPKWVSGVDLYCIPHYPTLWGELHFDCVDFGRYQGYSDHTEGILSAQVALVKGAKIIEKHFCLDHNLGVDAPWSMTPEELKELSYFAGNLENVL